MWLMLVLLNEINKIINKKKWWCYFMELKKGAEAPFLLIKN